LDGGAQGDACCWRVATPREVAKPARHQSVRRPGRLVVALLIYGRPEVLILPIDFHVGAHQRSTPCSVSDFLLQRAASTTMQQTFNRKNE
jgi:hypothetical protein